MKLWKKLIRFSRMPIFWQFIDLSTNDGYIKSLAGLSGLYSPNVSVIRDLDLTCTSYDDQDRLKILLTKFTPWLNEAKAKGIL
jgi:hypothetical protein